MTSHWMSRWQARFERLRDSLLAKPRVDRGVTAYRHYSDAHLSWLAGSLTYFAVLTLIPLFGMIYGAAVIVTAMDPSLRPYVDQVLQQEFGVSVDISSVTVTKQVHAAVRAIVATLGITGVAYAGRLWVQTYRRALKLIWTVGQAERTNFIWKQVRDLLIFLLFLGAILGLVALALFATPGPYKLAAAHGDPMPTWLVVTIRIAAVPVTVAWGFFICGALYHRLGGAPQTLAVRKAALLAGSCVAGLAIVGMLLVRFAFSDPVYGFALVIIGLMFWASAASRVTLSLAVWAADEDYGRPD